MSDVVIASDHAGVSLKTVLIDHLEQRGMNCLDLGTNGTASVDYPDFAQEVCGTFGGSLDTVGILICGTGIGMSIAANRRSGIRCALAVTVEMAKLARQHNDANVIALGARLIDESTAITIVDAFLDTPYEGGRHDARLQKLDPVN
jgi:ribose 5-phosphate isomerase B